MSLNLEEGQRLLAATNADFNDRDAAHSWWIWYTANAEEMLSLLVQARAVLIPLQHHESAAKLYRKLTRAKGGTDA